MKTLLFIFNLHAGKGRLGGRLGAILDTFSKAGYLVTACPTQGPQDAARLAASLGGEYDLVVCSGGDGTLNEVAAGLMQLPARPPLGYIPAGTTNDFARNLSLPRGLARAAATAVSGVPRPCDVGRLGERTFLYVAAFGAFTDVAYSTPQGFKNAFGHMAYLLEGIGKAGSLKSYPMTVRHDTGTEEGEFLFGMASNTVSVGGFLNLPPEHVSLEDGLFEVVLVRRPKNTRELQEIIASLTARTPSERGVVSAFHSAGLTVSCAEPVPWTLDGEYGGTLERAEIENLRHALTIIRGA